jgi:acetolactate synthase-1/2/3 large subunit
MSAPTCAEVLARTLREAGITRMFGLPGGEVLDLIEAGRREGIEFLLTRHEAAASFMADVTGQIQRRPGVCVATLGPGAVNMTLGVANAFLDRSPLLAITATLAHRNAGIATHQDLDLNALYRPITKLTLTIDGHDTAGKVRRALEVSMTPRMGPVHLTLPSDIAKTEDRPESERAARSSAPATASPEALDRVADRIMGAARAAIVIGIDVNPLVDTPAVRAFAEALGVPVFVTPKAKGIFPEDHPLFFGVCAGVSGDAVVCEWLGRADVLVGVGFDPVESDKVWHHTMPLVSIGPMSIATSQFQPVAEAVGDLPSSLATLTTRLGGKTFAWTPGDRDRFRTELETVLRPASRPRGLSGFELTRRLRERFPRDTVCVTDVGSVKMVTSQAWTAYEPLTFFESNGLSAMSYGFPGAMAARLQFPTRPILCTIGDGGFGMTIAELETCVRARLHFVTVVYNDSSLSLIDVAQERRGYPTTGVRHGRVDFAAAAAAFGAWSRRVETMDELDAALRESAGITRPVVIDAVVDPAEYRAHTRPRDQVRSSKFEVRS